jgi:hypothetical protein
VDFRIRMRSQVQGRPCGRPPAAALRAGNDTPATGEPASPSTSGGTNPRRTAARNRKPTAGVPGACPEMPSRF